MTDLPDTLPPPPTSRRRFLRLAATGGAGAGAAALLAACGDDGDSTAAAPATKPMTQAEMDGDLAILNYALTLEHLESDFYAKALAAGVLRPGERELAKRFGESERQHVQALSGTIRKLGGTPVAAPRTSFPLQDRRKVLELAATVENLGAAAYLGKAPEIRSPEVLAAALSIHSVEARHAAALNRLLGKSPTPDGAFAAPATEKQVLAAVKPFIQS